MESIPLYHMESILSNMTEIQAILRGSDEEVEPLKPCKVCGVLPTLDIMLRQGQPAARYMFSCPECGTEADPAWGFRTAKRYWNEGPAMKIIIKPWQFQKKVDDY